MSPFVAIVLMAVGFTLDIGERAGCYFLYCGCVASVGFVGFIGFKLWFLRHSRMKSLDECGCEYLRNDANLGKHNCNLEG